MKERPILFSAPMVRAILAGTKTQTRRVIDRPLKHEGWTAYRYFGPNVNNPTAQSCAIECGPDYPDDRTDRVLCPYGAPGDRLWVREAFRLCAEADSVPPRDTNAAYRVWFEANAPHQPGFGKLRPGMFMPRWASRITLAVTDVRVERLWDISESDAIAEGSREPTLVPITGARMTERGVYAALWESINGRGSWDENPWVWAISFRRVTPSVTTQENHETESLHAR